MLEDPFHGPRIKIARAREHLTEIARQEDRFFNAVNPVLYVDTDQDTGIRYAKVRIDEPLPDIIYILAGELIYQLRSSLDHIAVILAKMSNLGAAQVAGVKFPYGADAADFEKEVRKKLGAIDEDLRDQILAARVFPGGNDQLHAVCALANTDKHWTLIPAKPASLVVRVINYVPEGSSVSQVTDDTGPSLRDGIKIWNLGLDGAVRPGAPDAKVRVQGRAAIWNLPRYPQYDGMFLWDNFVTMCRAAADLQEGLEAYCKGTGRIAGANAARTT